MQSADIDNVKLDMAGEMEADPCETEEPENIMACGDDDQSSLPYYMRYGLEPEYYRDIEVSSLNISSWLGRWMTLANCRTVEDVLRANDNKMLAIRGFRKKKVEHLHEYLQHPGSSLYVADQTSKTQGLTRELIQYRKQIISGDFSFVDDVYLCERSMKYISRFKEAHAILDPDFVEELVNGTPAAMQVYGMMQEFIKIEERKKRTQKILDDTPDKRLALKTSWLIFCYSSDPAISNYLLSLLSDESMNLEEYIRSNADGIFHKDEALLRFLWWCQFDVHEDLRKLFSRIALNERELFIIRLRSEGQTLDIIGKQYGLTRERIRQIEERVTKKFKKWLDEDRIMHKICVELNKSTMLTKERVMELVGEHGPEFVYLLKKCVNTGFVYSYRLDLFNRVDASGAVQWTF